jgi:hypothetical protein
MRECVRGEEGKMVRGPTGQEEFGAEGMGWYECWRRG